MSHPTLLRQMRLQTKHQPTGQTKHYQGTATVPAPAMLHIVQFAGDSGYYLLYLDAKGQELTDTYHDTLAAALAQAQREFQIEPNEWDVLS